MYYITGYKSNLTKQMLVVWVQKFNCTLLQVPVILRAGNTDLCYRAYAIKLLFTALWHQYITYSPTGNRFKLFTECKTLGGRSFGVWETSENYKPLKYEQQTRYMFLYPFFLVCQNQMSLLVICTLYDYPQPNCNKITLKLGCSSFL